jgi:hypothetical protein
MDNLIIQTPKDLVMETQFNLNRFLGKELKIDGDQGNATNTALLDFHEKMLARFQNKGYKDIEPLEYVGVRMKQAYTNHFFDMACLMDIQNPQNTRLLDCSTLPGLYGEGAIMQPKKIYTTTFPQGFQGVGVLVPDRYKDSWFLVLENGQIYNSTKYWKVWSGNAYLMQSKAVKIGRDGNRDSHVDFQVYEIDWNGKVGQIGAEIGVNHHGWYDYETDIVNNISLACQIYQKSRLRVAVDFWKRSIDLKKRNEITYTLIDF